MLNYHVLVTFYPLAKDGRCWHLSIAPLNPHDCQADYNVTDRLLYDLCRRHDALISAPPSSSFDGLTGQWSFFSVRSPQFAADLALRCSIPFESFASLPPSKTSLMRWHKQCPCGRLFNLLYPQTSARLARSMMPQRSAAHSWLALQLCTAGLRPAVPACAEQGAAFGRSGPPVGGGGPQASSRDRGGRSSETLLWAVWLYFLYTVLRAARGRPVHMHPHVSNHSHMTIGIHMVQLTTHRQTVRYKTLHNAALCQAELQHFLGAWAVHCMHAIITWQEFQ